jgi:hypothetical protein
MARKTKSTPGIRSTLESAARVEAEIGRREKPDLVSADLR